MCCMSCVRLSCMDWTGNRWDCSPGNKTVIEKEKRKKLQSSQEKLSSSRNSLMSHHVIRIKFPWQNDINTKRVGKRMWRADCRSLIKCHCGSRIWLYRFRFWTSWFYSLQHERRSCLRYLECERVARHKACTKIKKMSQPLLKNAAAPTFISFEYLV